MSKPFFERWAARKHSANQEHTKQQPPVEDQLPPIINNDAPIASDELAAAHVARCSEPLNTQHPPLVEDVPSLTLDDVNNWQPEQSLTAFLAQGVAKEVKRAALDKWFRQPEFNQLDGLTTDSKDFSNLTKLKPELVASVRRWVNETAVEQMQPQPTPQLAPEDNHAVSTLAPPQAEQINTEINAEVAESNAGSSPLTASPAEPDVTPAHDAHITPLHNDK